MPGRRWSNGLHQAIEAKEGVKVEPENVTYATITLQNYYRMYDKICGMTGTALTEKEEFYKIYGLDVIPVPTNLEFSARQKNSELIERTAKDETGFKYTFYALRSDPETPVYFKRKDYEDVIYQSEEAKFATNSMRSSPQKAPFRIRSRLRLLEDVRPLLRARSEEHTSELQSLSHLVCRLLLEKKNGRAHV